MSVFDRGIRGNVQSPFNSLGDASTLGYSNPRLPQAYGGNVQLALDYIADALYPNYKGTVPTKAALPTTAQVNDYFIVSDDGDGKSAGYVWSDLQGMTSWVKRYDVDYSAEGILAEAMDRTSYQYVSKYGSQDKDKDGNPITGRQAGQTVYGGKDNAENLTLIANAHDLTGTINVANDVLPLTETLSLGSLDEPFLNVLLSNQIIFNGGEMVLNRNSIAVNNGGDLNLYGANVRVQPLLVAASGAVFGSTLTLNSGQITDSSDSIDFSSNSLVTSGPITAGSLQVTNDAILGNFQFSGDTISNSDSAISFNSADLSDINSVSTNSMTTGTAYIGQLTHSNATIQNTGGTPLVLQSTNVSVGGALGVQGALTGQSSATFSGVIKGQVLQGGNASRVSSVGSDARVEALTGNLQLNSTSAIQTNQSVTPSVDNAQNLGTSGSRFNTAFIGTGLSDGVNNVSIQSLLSLRDINTNATSGMSLFYNGTEWLPSLPDTEIVHSTLSGLTTGDAGHTQFALLAGRAGGQQINGGSASGENLTLDSTSNATKGLVRTSSTFVPTATNAVDLGTSSLQFKDMYSSGVHNGLRFEQYAGQANYPTNASTRIGHVIWDTSSNQLLVDNGVSWSKVGNQKWLSDITTDGTTTSYTVNVSASISDARTGMWQLLDNSNGFQQVYANVNKTLNTVTVTTTPALPAGTYRLVGFN